MLLTLITCPRCDVEMVAGPAKVDGGLKLPMVLSLPRIAFTLMCPNCPLTTELTTASPARLVDLGGLTMQEAQRNGIPLTPVTRTTTPVSRLES